MASYRESPGKETVRLKEASRVQFDRSPANGTYINLCLSNCGISRIRSVSTGEMYPFKGISPSEPVRNESYAAVSRYSRSER